MGLALAESRLAEPWKVIRFNDLAEAIKKITLDIELEKIEEVVVGVSENQIGEESKRFGLNLHSQVKIPVVTFDETLTTWEAQKLAIQAGLKRQKRRALEDAYAATLMLQSYLDRKKINV